MKYRNPVYQYSCPDPFVIKYRGQYWCYYTGIQPDGRCFGILFSPDLVHWSQVGSAMDPLPQNYTSYWAPEVTYDNGTFYMYYSAGNETYMHIRVAEASHPAGPFIDSGNRLTKEDFAIDAHVFVDDNGQRFLFYATDYLTHDRVGTGTAFDRLLDPYTTSGHSRPVTRARYDWQIYDPQRREKGGVKWHTIEGPFVLKHQGKYYQMFSGGNWQNESYGLGYAVAENLDSQNEWDQCCDGINSPQVLKTDRERGVIGPGHNSVVRGPDNCTLFCVYHRWRPEIRERVLAIDPLFWQDEKLMIAGPSTTEQDIPQPQISGVASLEISGSGRRNEDILILSGTSSAAIPIPGKCTLEFTFKMTEENSRLILELLDGFQNPVHLVEIRVHGQSTTFSTDQLQKVYPATIFDPHVDHLFHLERNQDTALLQIDSPLIKSSIALSSVSSFRMQTNAGSVEFTGFAVADKVCSDDLVEN